VEALSLKRERHRWELQRAFGFTPEDAARAQWQHSTRAHWSLDALSAAGGARPSLPEVGGVAAQGLSRSAADTRRLRHVAQVFRDVAEEASASVSGGTPVLGRSATVTADLVAAQGPSSMSASASEPAPRGPGSGTSGGRPGYRLAHRGGRRHLLHGSSVRDIRADTIALMHASWKFAGDTTLGLVAFHGNSQTACDGSGLNDGTEVTLLQYFATSEVLGVIH